MNLNSLEFENQTVIVTGAGSGIGRACALRFATGGANIVVVDIDGSTAQETVDRIVSTTDGTAVAVQADVTQATDAKRMVSRAIENYGRLDVLHNNAGIVQKPALVEDLKEETWDGVIDVNLKGVFLGAKYATPRLEEQGGGVIVNTASTAAIRPRRGAAAYTASKGGIVALTKQLARELVEDGIRVNAVCPVATDTPLLSDLGGSDVEESDVDELVESIPMGWLVEPEEVAATVTFLAGDEAEMITGVGLPIDGGRCL